jgi:DNA-binding NtrC family response regulator
VALIHLPPLRDRQGDLRDLITRDPVTGNESRIPGLVSFFTERYAAEFGSTIPPVTEEAFHELEQYEWPGNVRELRNVIRKALLLARGYAIDPKVIHTALAQMAPPRPAVNQTFAEYVSEVLARTKSGELEDVQEGLTETVERELYSQAIQRAKGDQSKAARWLGVSRPTMLEKLRRLDLYPTTKATT